MPFLALIQKIAMLLFSICKNSYFKLWNQWFNVRSSIGAWLLPCSEYYTFPLLSRKDVCSFMHLFPCKESKWFFIQQEGDLGRWLAVSALLKFGNLIAFCCLCLAEMRISATYLWKLGVHNPNNWGSRSLIRPAGTALQSHVTAGGLPTGMIVLELVCSLVCHQLTW